MSRQSWVELVVNATSDATAVANTTTETVLFPNITIPANTLQDSRAWIVKARGKHSTTGTPTLTFLAYLGGIAGTLLCKSAAITCGSTSTNALWTVEIEFTVRANGSSGSVMANGVAEVFAGAAPTVGSATACSARCAMTNGGVVTPAAATVNLTADQAFALSVIWGTASASNTITGLQLYHYNPN